MKAVTTSIQAAAPTAAVRRAGVRPRVPFAVAAPCYLVLILGMPMIPIALLVKVAGSTLALVAALIVAVPLYAVTYGLTAASVGWLYRKSIVAGRFKRDLGTDVYRARRLYGLAWTAVCYAPPVYHLFLAIPILKRALFRMFGYRGSMHFTAYPDTWIRDLALLRFGDGAYISNRATLGTNIVFRNGWIRVDHVTIEEGALVGHLCMVGPGASLGPHAELGVGAAIGIRTRIAAGARIGPKADIDNGVAVGEGTIVGARSYIGSRSRIAPGLVLPPRTIVPPRTILRSQADVERLRDMPTSGVSAASRAGCYAGANPTSTV